MREIFYFTDVHGNYQLYRAALDYCFNKDRNYTLICGGDACDRGLEGYKIMCELLDNPHVIYLKGNHEDMFVSAARFILNNYHGPTDDKTIKNYLYSLAIKDNCVSQIINCIYNGGFPTLAAWMAAGMPNDFVTAIDKLPLTFSYENLDFCHAGAQYKIFERVVTDEHNGELPDLDDATDLLWDRNMLSYGWKPGRICIYGHTPVRHLPSKYYGQDKSYANIHPCKYVGQLDDRLTGAKIAMDVGTADTNKLYVLNCLTLKAQGFRYDEKNNMVEEIEVIQL